MKNNEIKSHRIRLLTKITKFQLKLLKVFKKCNNSTIKQIESYCIKKFYCKKYLSHIKEFLYMKKKKLNLI